MAKGKYESHVLPHLEKISRWATEGMTAKDIAEKLRIAYSSFKKYLAAGREGDERYAALAASFAQACEEPDENVKNALYRKCIGYNAQVVKHYKLRTVEYDPETGRRICEREELVEALDEVHVPADTAAQMFWLTNRRGDEWSYKPGERGAVEQGGVVYLPQVSALSSADRGDPGGQDCEVDCEAGERDPSLRSG